MQPFIYGDYFIEGQNLQEASNLDCPPFEVTLLSFVPPLEKEASTIIHS